MPDDITLGQFISSLWRKKWLILLGGLLGAGLLFLYTFTIPVRYEASALLVSPSGQTNNSLPFGDISSLASQFGLNRGNDTFAQYNALLTSHRVAKILWEDKAVVDSFFVRDPKNPAAYKKLESGIWLKRKLDRLFGVERNVRPDYTALKAILDSIVVMDTSGTDGIRQLRVRHGDPEMAKHILLRLHQEANTILKEKLQQDALQAIQHFSKSANKISELSMRNFVFKLLEEKERELLLSSVDTPVGATMLDYTSGTLEAVSPRPFLNMVIGFMLGIFGTTSILTVFLFLRPGR